MTLVDLHLLKEAEARADAAERDLADLIERLHRAEMELRRTAATRDDAERARLMAKVSGVTLALSYAREAQRGRVVGA